MGGDSLKSFLQQLAGGDLGGVFSNDNDGVSRIPVKNMEYQDIKKRGYKISNGWGFWESLRNNQYGCSKSDIVRGFVDGLREMGLSDPDIVLFGDWGNGHYMMDIFSNYRKDEQNYELMKRIARMYLVHNKTHSLQTTVDEVVEGNRTDYSDQHRLTAGFGVSNMGKTRMTKEQAFASRMEGYAEDDAIYNVEQLSWFEVPDPRNGMDTLSQWVLRDAEGHLYAVICEEKTKQKGRRGWRKYVVPHIWVGDDDASQEFETFEAARQYIEVALARVFYPWEMAFPVICGTDGTPLPDGEDVLLVHIVGWTGGDTPPLEWQPEGDTPPLEWRLSKSTEAFMLLLLTGRMRLPVGQRPEDVLSAKVMAILQENSMNLTALGPPITIESVGSFRYIKKSPKRKKRKSK